MTIQSNPLVTSRKIPQATEVSNTPQKVLVIGQLLSSGTATDGDLQQSIGNAKEEDALFGAGSQLSGMLRQFKELNKNTRIDAIGIADAGASVKATAEIAFTGTATEDGELSVVIGSREKHTYDLDILSGDDDVAIGSALITAVNADTNAPFIASTDNTDLVLNGNFETDILNWVKLGGASNTGVLSQSSTYAYTGTNSLRYFGGTVAYGFNNIADLFTTVTGKKYRYKFAVKTVAGGVGEKFAFNVKKGDGSGLVTLENVTLTADWVEYSGEYIETAGGVSAFVQIEHTLNGITDMFIDNISIQEASNTVVLTANNGGTVANNFGIEASGVINGLTYALTAWSGGATDPTVTNTLDVIGSERYNHIIFPVEYDFTFIDSFISNRWNSTNKYITGFAYTTKTDTLANLKITANTLNNQALVLIGDKVIDETNYKGSSMMEFDYFKTASCVAVISKRLTTGTDLSRILTVKDAPKDLIGGSARCSLPIHNTLLTNLSISDVDKGFTEVEIGELIDVGVTTIGNNTANNSVITGQFATTYKTDNAGNPDTSWKYLNYALTADVGAEFIFNNAKADFAQSRLTNGRVFNNLSIENAGTIKAKIMGYFDRLSSEDYLVFQGGQTQRKIFENNLNIETNLLSGQVIATGVANMVSQIREIIITLQYGFEAE